MLTTHAVGIDLGTTYSCISYLNEHGEPVTLANLEGELSTPSAVLVEDDEIIVGTEALRNSIVRPDRVIVNSKRFIGNTRKSWDINGRRFTPVDAAACILKKLIHDAQEQIGPIEQAVITVPAQFTDFQRHATIEAGHRAGLQRVDIINEPVAAALCHVLGTEGLWFTELAEEQRILVYDLGGGTFDLSIVAYRQNEVRVIASAGDLELGGIDWTRVLVDRAAKQFSKEFGSDPRDDPESLQALTLEAEQTKRSLTVRPRSSLLCQHAGDRANYQIEQGNFEKLAAPLVERTAEITQRMLKDNRMGWAHVDVVLTTGGSSRMPMIRNRLKKLSGRTLNTTLSPDQSISHGATYYAGMLLSNNKFAQSILSAEASSRLASVRQRSVNARALGVIIRDVKTQQRVPHYLIQANTPLPTSITHHFGTVVDNQKRVHVQIVESAVNPDQQPVRLGDCVIEDLPENLPDGSQIAVTIHYDEQARVHVSARDVTSGKEASTELLRQENVMPQLATDQAAEAGIGAVAEVRDASPDRPIPPPVPPVAAAVPASKSPRVAETRMKQPRVAESARTRASGVPRPRPVPPPPAASNQLRDHEIESSSQPVPLCNDCGEPLDRKGKCPACGYEVGGTPAEPPKPDPRQTRDAANTRRPGAAAAQRRKRADKPSRPVSSAPRRPVAPPPDDDDILELGTSQRIDRPPRKEPRVKPQPRRKPKDGIDPGEDEFWKLTD